MLELALKLTITQLGLSAVVVSLGKKLYSHCLSYPAVKPGTYCILSVIRAQLKSRSIADVAIPVKKSKHLNLPNGLNY